jgi:hypothetical protein
MMKKVLILFLLFAYVNCYIGCSTTTRLTRKNYDEFNKAKIDEPVIVKTKDLNEYYFRPFNCHFYNDRITGTAKINDESEYKWVRLAGSDILSISIVQEDKSLKIITTVGVIFTALSLVGILYFIKKQWRGGI